MSQIRHSVSAENDLLEAWHFIVADSVEAADRFPKHIPLSADSRDIFAYVDQRLTERKPVGYQHEFLAAYQPNLTWYLSARLRRQLHKTGDTGQIRLPAGAYGRAVLARSAFRLGSKKGWISCSTRRTVSGIPSSSPSSRWCICPFCSPFRRQ